MMNTFLCINENLFSQSLLSCGMMEIESHIIGFWTKAYPGTQPEQEES